MFRPILYSILLGMFLFLRGKAENETQTDDILKERKRFSVFRLYFQNLAFPRYSCFCCLQTPILGSA